MRTAAYALLVTVMVWAAAGCVPSHPIETEQLAEAWSIQQDTWSGATRPAVEIGQTPVPTRWVFRRDDSLIWSTVSIVRATDKLKAGTDEIEVSISPEHARYVADLLAQTRRTIEELRPIADPDTKKNPEQWVDAVTGALVSAETIVRRSTDEGRRDEQADDGLGWTAGPMIQMLVQYMNQRTAGGLLEDLGAGGIGQLREVVAQTVLRLAFAGAGKQTPPELRQRVVMMMQLADRPEALRDNLAGLLKRELAAAPPARAGSQLPQLMETVFDVAPPMLEVMEDLIRQWKNVDLATFELRRAADDTLLGATLKVREGRELHIKQILPMQPLLAFTGTTRMVVYPRLPGSGATAVHFAPEAEGQVELRLEGLGWGLARLFAVPIDSAALREIRVSRGTSAGVSVTHVTLVMDALQDAKDPRRVMVVQDVYEPRVIREPFAVRVETALRETTFHYLTPARRYTYVREKKD